MSFGVDTLGLLIEKLKQLVNDTQDNYESFFDSTQLFKQGKMESNEYFSRMGEFLVSSSALNFLACRVILELKTALDKTGSTKGKGERSSTSPPSTSPSTFPSSYPSGSGNGGSGSYSGGGGGGFGVDGFISAGGHAGSPSPSPSPSHSTYPSAPSSTSEEYDFPLPQEVPTYKPVDIIITKQDSLDSKGLKKNCIVCAASIPKQAKFCNKCGNSQ
ncbi:hypothetical protein NMY3_00505 [Candidatus Nitrosocosmicus oleophilus]|uniref:Zinc-ribbon domain-containing protein n=1 Tax=Candidatus Nitrosocosmicus oleophilus TaxID=1353260 RepID=A0A654LUR2_9ARCH|nr:hypothetical protein [Candidatus Nitrosocosmicus oleophilus]ALI34717.1 hypothetical protein NMY3_00505 [Candidatus Nitrosocosmicus oleophilus]